jgi:sn-glycerol 3-phosphate transport system permease protein
MEDAMVEKKGAHAVVSHLILLLGAVLVLFPIYIALVAASHPAEALIGTTPLWFGPRLFENFSSVLGHGLQAAGGAPVWRMLANSTVMAVGIALGKILISLLSAFAIVYFRLPGRQLCFFLIFITLMLPVEIRIVPTFEVANQLGLIDSYLGLIFPLIASATATFLYRQFFLTIPDELLEAARIDGAGPWRFFRDVVLPLSRTNTAALFVVTFIYGWNQYLWPLLITNQESMYTVVMAIQRMVNVPDAPVEWNLVMTTALLGLLPPLLVVLGMQRLFIKGLIETEK